MKEGLEKSVAGTEREDRLRAQHTYTSSAGAPFKELRKVWNKLPDMCFTTLVRSMVKLCDAIANVRGKTTKY